MQHYSFPYSLTVVERFLDFRPRGWHDLRKVLDNFYVEDVVELFQKHQFKWNVFKKLVKHLDRVSRPNYLTYDKAKELWRYFYQVQSQEATHGALLTRHGRQ